MEKDISQNLDSIKKTIDSIDLQRITSQIKVVIPELLVCIDKLQPLNNRATALNSIIGRLPKALSKARGGLILFGYALVETLKYAAAGEEMSGLIKQSGVATDKFQSLANAAKRYGGTALATSNSMNSLRKNLEDLQKGGDGNGLKETLKAFNINANGIKSTDQMLEVIAGRMATLKTETEKLDFGRALGLDDATIKVLCGGVDEYREGLKDASKYNVFTSKDIERAGEFEETLRCIGAGLGTLLADVAQLILPILLPIMKGVQVVTDFIAEHATFVKFLIVGLCGVFIAAFFGLISSVTGAIAAVVAIATVFGDFIGWINGEENNLFHNIFGDFETLKEGLISGFQQIGQNIVNFFVGMGQAIKSGFMAVVGFVQSIVDKVMSFIPEWLLSFIKGGGTIGLAINAVSKGKEMLAGNKNATAANGIGFVQQLLPIKASPSKGYCFYWC